MKASLPGLAVLSLVLGTDVSVAEGAKLQAF